MPRSNNNEVFLEKYKPIHDIFTRYCSNQAFGILSTEDLMQEAIYLTLNAFDKIRDQDRLLGYMIGVVNNLVKNQKRRQKFKGEWHESQVAFLTDKISDPGLIIDLKYLHECIRKLPQNQQEALILFEICGCSIKEIAEIQEDRESTVKTRIHRARKKLKSLYEEPTKQRSLQRAMSIYVSIFL